MGTEATFSYISGNPATETFRVTVRYASGASATSDPIIIPVGAPQPRSDWWTSSRNGTTPSPGRTRPRAGPW